MTITDGDNVFDVRFRHYTEGHTECVIEFHGARLRGIAMLHENDLDKYNKALGRKMAFQRAVEHFDRATRRVLWNAFLRECKVPTWRGNEFVTTHVPFYTCDECGEDIDLSCIDDIDPLGEFKGVELPNLPGVRFYPIA